MAFIQESEWWRGEILGVVVGFCAERKRKGSEIKAVDAKNNKIVFFSFPPFLWHSEAARGWRGRRGWHQQCQREGDNQS